MICGIGLRVVDAEMNDVARDGVALGEVVMQGENVMAGYYQDRDATERAMRGNWFHSGDRAVWHPEAISNSRIGPRT